MYTQLLPINPTQIPEESSAREHLRMRFYIFLPMAKTLGECYHQNTKIDPRRGSTPDSAEDCSYDCTPASSPASIRSD